MSRLRVGAFSLTFVFAMTVPQFWPAAGLTEPGQNTVLADAHLFPVKLGGKWGYMDQNGTLTIAPKFDAARPFREGLAAVLTGKGYGFIDQTGAFRIPPRFSRVTDFACGLSGVIEDGRKAYVRASGEIAFPTNTASNPSKFSDGFAVVAQRLDLPQRPSLSETLYGYIDTDGQFAIPPQFAFAMAFSDGLAAVRVETNLSEAEAVDGMTLWGFVSPSGTYAIPPRYADVRPFSGGRAAVRKPGGRWEFITPTGALVCETSYESLKTISEGTAAAKWEGSWGYISRDCRIVIEPRFQAAGHFFGGVAPIQLEDRWWIIDTAGVLVAGPIDALSMSDFEGGLSRVLEKSDQYYVDPRGNRIDPSTEPPATQR